MARWRLTTPHYLNVEGTVWEYKELDRTTGKQIRKAFPVPTYLNPDDSADWNHKYDRDNGEIIVSDGNNPHPKDLIFSGPPTPDMFPLDDEAQAITAEWAKRWKHPIEDLPGTMSYSQSLLDNLQRQMAEVQVGAAQKPVEISGMQEFMASVAAVMKQQTQILDRLAPAAEEPVEEQVEETEDA